MRAVYVDIDPAATEQRRSATGPRGAQGVPLVVLASPYRSLMEPLLEYIEQMQRASQARYVTVVLPEFVPARWWQHLLHNQHALLIKGALLFKPNIVVTSVPFHLRRDPRAAEMACSTTRRQVRRPTCRRVGRRVAGIGVLLQLESSIVRFAGTARGIVMERAW